MFNDSVRDYGPESKKKFLFKILYLYSSVFPWCRERPKITMLWGKLVWKVEMARNWIGSIFQCYLFKALFEDFDKRSAKRSVTSGTEPEFLFRERDHHVFPEPREFSICRNRGPFLQSPENFSRPKSHL